MSELQHWGIKGQKWGERRWQYEDGTLTPEGKIRYSSHYNVRSRVKNKKERMEYDKETRAYVYNMDTTELQESVRRMQLEKQYFELLGKEYVSTGKKIADKILDKATETGTQMLINDVKEDIVIPLKKKTKKQAKKLFKKEENTDIIP